MNMNMSKDKHLPSFRAGSNSSRSVWIAVIVFLLSAVIPIMNFTTTPVQAASSAVPARVTLTGAKLSSDGANGTPAKVTVTWKKAKNATSYRVYYKQAGGKWKALANVGGAKYTHTSSKKYPLTAGKKYQYTVRAYNRYSRKWGSYDTKGRAVTIPLVPGTVKVKNVHAKDYRTVTISWNKVSNATSYHVYYKESGARNWVKIANLGNKTSAFVHSSSSSRPLKPGKRYLYTVRAYNGTFKKWGGFNSKGWSVSVPKKPAPQPTAIPKPTATPEPTATPTPADADAEKLAKEVIKLTNVERKKMGLSEVKYHARLQQAAMVRAKELEKAFSHTRPDGRGSETALFEAGVGSPENENIGLAVNSTPQGIVDAWIKSPGHCATIMDPSNTHLGVGYYKAKDGTEYWTQEFSSNPDAKCTLTVDGNGGVFPDKDGVEKYEMVVPQGMTLEADDFEKPVKVGCVFEKWTSVYANGYENKKTTTLYMTESKTLKANWTTSSTASQSLFTDTPASITEDLFTDGTADNKSTEETQTDTITPDDSDTPDTIEIE